MPGAGFMKHGAEATANNRSVLKRNGRFVNPTNMFDRLKHGNIRAKKLYTYKQAHPELIAAIRLRMKEERAAQRQRSKTLLIVCAVLFVAFIALLIFILN